jgi:hypothetical protein
LLLCSAVPFVGMLGGVAFVNQATPFVLGLPLPLAWITLWVVLTVAIMAGVYAFDPANHAAKSTDAQSGMP